MTRTVFGATLVLCLAAEASAQEAQHAPADEQRLRAPDRVVISASAARNSPRGRWLGRTPGRDVLLTSVRSVWLLAGADGPTLSYVVDLLPLAVVTDNPTHFLSHQQCMRARPDVREEDLSIRTTYYEKCAASVKNAYGIGLSPVGFEARLLRAGGVGILADVSIGGIVFNRPMPYPDAARLNFNIAAGAGVELPLSRTLMMTIGYRLHHLSSGGRGQFNPGVGAHAVTIGWGHRSAPAKE
jgi:hypothetical protein